MFKRLRSWFSWRFSLTRLVVAVVFLGVFVGLNLLGPKTLILSPALDTPAVQLEESGDVTILYGWPLIAARDNHAWNPASDGHIEALSLEQSRDGEWLPWTHQTYWLSEYEWLSRLGLWGLIEQQTPTGSFCFLPTNATINILFALTVLSLILCLHPRRKPEPEGAK